MQNDRADGERHTVVDRGAEIPAWRELQAVPRAIGAQTQGVAVGKFQVFRIEQPAIHPPTQMLDGGDLNLQLEAADTRLAGVVGSETQAYQLADLHILVFGVE